MGWSGSSWEEPKHRARWYWSAAACRHSLLQYITYRGGRFLPIKNTEQIPSSDAMFEKCIKDLITFRYLWKHPKKIMGFVARIEASRQTSTHFEFVFTDSALRVHFSNQWFSMTSRTSVGWHLPSMQYQQQHNSQNTEAPFTHYKIAHMSLSLVSLWKMQRKKKSKTNANEKVDCLCTNCF